MKKFLLLAALLALLSESSFASLGSFYAGGTIGYFSSSPSSSGSSGSSSGGGGPVTYIDNKSSSEFSISPEVGFNINNKFDAGLRFTYSTKSASYIYGSGTVKTTGYGIAPYVRYELAKVGDFRFLAKVMLSYDTAKDDVSWSGPSSKSLDTFGFLLSPVVEYKVTKYFSLVATAGELGLSYSSQGKMSNTTFGFNKGLGGELGVSFNFK